MSAADLVERYLAGEKEMLLGCPMRLSRALAAAGKARNRCPQRARHRPAWWDEVAGMRALDMNCATIGRAFGVTKQAVSHAVRRMEEG